MILSQAIRTPFTGVKLFKFGPSILQVAPITSKSSRGEPLNLPPPFPYKEKKYSMYYHLFDSTMLRLSSENAKVIVVEGPIGVGKSGFCKAIAEELEMHYLPQPTMDEIYIFPSGYDMREIDHLIPEEVRTYDHKNFCVNPKTWKALYFQRNMLYLRFLQYFDALCHLFNTGQGVVLERSFFSDYVFMNAMHKCNYVSTALKNAYFTIRNNTAPFLLHPHLVIYLDISVPVVQERIRTRNYSWEQNSPALTKQYLECLEKGWKQDYLREASARSEVLIYDWSDGGDIEVVIDDIEKLDFDVMRRDRKFVEWWLNRGTLNDLRYRYTNQKGDHDKYFYYPWHELDEFKLNFEHVRERDKILSDNPETKYDTGYNPLMGDSIWKILFKMKKENRRSPKFHVTILKPWGP